MESILQVGKNNLYNVNFNNDNKTYLPARRKTLGYKNPELLMAVRHEVIMVNVWLPVEDPHIEAWEWKRKTKKCFFTYIHLDLFRSHPSICWVPDNNCYYWFVMFFIACSFWERIRGIFLGLRAKKCFFVYIHIVLFRFHPSNFWA